jgi:pilus assembly protein CpaB
VKTLLQNIEVLSAGTNFQKDTEGKPVQVPVVNLLVTPEQAEVLSLASDQTTIQLILRNPPDTDPRLPRMVPHLSPQKHRDRNDLIPDARA